MAEVVHADMVEQVLLRLDVKNLIRYKSVCKSWHSLITSTRFINGHLNRSYNKDRYNNELGSRRIRLGDFISRFYRLVGSSNGLACIILDYGWKVLVGDPLTRELRKLVVPRWMYGFSLCYGFGYDSCTDDYKVFVGAEKGESRTCVRVLSLKSNVWRVIREVEYTFITTAGILCNGALHWLVKDDEKKKKYIIISFDLSKEEFIEIPQPEGKGCQFRDSWSYRLGTMKDCLCIFAYSCVGYVWLMKKYNVKESWEMLSPDSRHHVRKHNIVHYLHLPMDESFFLHCSKSWFSKDLAFIDAPIFVQSLVSPTRPGAYRGSDLGNRWNPYVLKTNGTFLVPKYLPFTCFNMFSKFGRFDLNPFCH